MHIEVSTDNSIDGSEAFTNLIKGLVQHELAHLDDHLTRIEVHLSDESSDKKFGTEDKRCLLEARLAGLQPISVRYQAATLEQAVDGAVEKLKRSLDSTLGRLGTR